MKRPSTSSKGTKRDDISCDEMQCEQLRRKWRDDNREAIEEANAELGENGLWSDGLRPF